MILVNYWSQADFLLLSSMFKNVPILLGKENFESNIRECYKLCKTCSGPCLGVVLYSKYVKEPPPLPVMPG